MQLILRVTGVLAFFQKAAFVCSIELFASADERRQNSIETATEFRYCMIHVGVKRN